MPRILYLLPGLVPPQPDAKLDRYFYLSEIAEGDILLPVWFRSAEEAAQRIGDRFPAVSVGAFTYHLFLNFKFPNALRGPARFFFFVWRGLALHKRRNFDAIAAYGTNMPGLAAAVLKLLTGCKLIVEVPGSPDKAYLIEPKVTWIHRLKKRLSDLFLHLSVGSADCAYLRYPTQLAAYPLLRNKPVAVFPNLVPVKGFTAPAVEEKVVLMVGAPWYLKGADLVIRAFKLIAPRVPAYKLRLIGHYPDRQYLDDLARGCDQVEFVRPVNDYRESLRRIASCSVFVLASRAEAMARVLLEAMAARKPIVASAIDGIPFYIRDGENGLLFPPGDVEALAERMLTLIENPALAQRLARCAYERVHQEFDERAFVRNFHRLLEIAGVTVAPWPPAAQEARSEP
jgi:glycosyltransferase involved in cell wall biosynthesis